MVAVPAAPPLGSRLKERARRIVENARPAAVLSTASELAAVRQVLADVLTNVQVLDIGAIDAQSADVSSSLRFDELALLQYTSGSTTAPRGVMVEHRHLMANQRMIAQAMGHGSDADFVSWLPPFHDMGLMGNLLQPIYLGSTCTFMPPAAFARRPLRWLEAVSTYRAHTSGAPNFGFDLCVDALEKEPAGTVSLDLSCWRIAYSGAEPVRRSTLDRFARAFEPFGFRREALYPTYGLAEATLMVAGHRSVFSGLPRSVGQHVSCGIEVAPDTIAIVEPTTRCRLPEGAVGEVWVTGDHICAGYWGDARGSEGIFHAQIESDPRTYLRTGDLGYLDQRELFICGRLTDQIIVRGINLDPHDIETAAAAVMTRHDVRHQVVAFQLEGSTDQLVILLCEGALSDAQAWGTRAREILQEVACRIEIRLDAVVLVRSGTLPRTSSGKIQRSSCRDRYAEKSLRVIREIRFDEEGSSWTKVSTSVLAGLPEEEREAEILSLMKRQVAAILGISPSALDTSAPLSHYGWDSLAAVTFTHDIERCYGLVLPERLSLQERTLVSIAAFLARRIAAVPSVEHAKVAIVRKPDLRGLPLSVGQRAFWFLTHLAPESSAFNLSLVAAIQGEFDVDIFRRCLRRWIDSHAVVHSRLRWTGESYIQERVLTGASEPLRVVDAATLSKEGGCAIAWDTIRRPFDLLAEQPWRCTLVRSEGCWTIAFCIHHLAADFRSLCLMVNSVVGLYVRALETGAVPNFTCDTPFDDFVTKERDELLSDRGDRMRRFWKDRLEGHLEPLELPYLKPATPSRPEAGALLHHQLDGAAKSGIEGLARKVGTTPFAVCLALFSVLLNRLTERRRFVVGTPVSLRSQRTYAETIGCLANVLPLPVDLRGNPTFEDVLARIDFGFNQCIEHADLPFADIVDVLRLPRAPGRMPLVDVLFSWQKAAQGSLDQGLTGFALKRPGAVASVGPFDLRLVDMPAMDAQYDLSLMMGYDTENLWLALEYRPCLYCAEAMRQFLRDYEELAHRVARNPAATLSSLAMPSNADDRGVPALATEKPLWTGAEETICQSFDRSVRLWPDRVAVSCGRLHLTYRALDRLSGVVARKLLVSGARVEEPVAITTLRTTELVVGLLGVIKAGCAYVPLEPGIPSARRSAILQACGCRRLLISPGLVEAHRDPSMIVCEIAPRLEQSPVTRPVRGGHLAYIIHTSGSTGTPKSVMVEHRSVVNLVRSFDHWLPESASGLRWTMLHALGFDLSVWEIFGALLSGGALSIVGEHERGDMHMFAALLRQRQIEVLSLTPSMLQSLLGTPTQAGADSPLAMVRRLAIGGEAMTAEIADKLAELSLCAWNFYGPTEATVWAAACPVRVEGGVVLIGGPIAGARLEVLDDQQRPRSLGANGELAIAGGGLARGYLNSPAATARVFVPDPVGVGQRIYLTGDRARATGDGHYEFLGRRDSQVKVRGYRIDVAEIERILEHGPGVAQAVVVIVGESPASRQLAAFATTTAGAEINERSLQDWLAERLPSHMVPQAVIGLSQMPCTPNGKKDREAVRRLADSPMSKSRTLSQDAKKAEEEVKRAWSRVLGHGSSDSDISFFDAGGNSLTMVQLHKELEQTFHRPLALIDLYRWSTVTDMARLIEGAASIVKVPASGGLRSQAVRDELRTRRMRT